MPTLLRLIRCSSDSVIKLMGREPLALSLCCTLAGAGRSVSGGEVSNLWKKERFILFLLQSHVCKIRVSDTCWEESRDLGDCGRSASLHTI